MLSVVGARLCQCNNNESTIKSSRLSVHSFEGNEETENRILMKEKKKKNESNFIAFRTNGELPEYRAFKMKSKRY